MSSAVITIEEYERRLAAYFKERQSGPCEKCGTHCDDTRRLGLCPDCWFVLMFSPPK